jgi:hypothetical protein
MRALSSWWVDAIVMGELNSWGSGLLLKFMFAPLGLAFCLALACLSVMLSHSTKAPARHKLHALGLPSFQKCEKQINFAYIWPSLRYSVITVESRIRHTIRAQWIFPGTPGTLGSNSLLCQWWNPQPPTGVPSLCQVLEWGWSSKTRREALWCSGSLSAGEQWAMREGGWGSGQSGVFGVKDEAKWKVRGGSRHWASYWGETRSTEAKSWWLISWMVRAQL